jgi:hypothetical protein
MADEPLSTKDLFLLAVGLFQLKTPPSDTGSGRDFYLDKEKNNALRETKWNVLWLLNPAHAWEGVRHRDWLFANLAANLTGSTHDFVAIAEPVFVSLDLLGSEFKPGTPPNPTKAIEQAVSPEGGYSRGIFTTLTVGLSQQESAGKPVVVLGAGMRRRTRVWKEESQALQADLEFYVPFLPFTGGDEPADKTLPNARSINAGIRITRANGSSIGLDKDGKDLAGVRFNLRVPFTARVVKKYDEEKGLFIFRDMDYEALANPFKDFFKWEPDDLFTDFDKPTVEVQKLPLKGVGSEPPKWEAFKDWKDFVKKFCESPDGGELLKAPVGPLLLETVSDSSGLKDILKSQRGPIEKDLKESQEALKEAAALLKGIFAEGKVPEAGEEADKADPNSSMRQLGGLLESLGLLKGKDGKYSPADLSELKVWDVLNRLLDELDGFPLYVSGVDPKEPDGKRIALSLASQTALAAPLKQYFGLAGLAYNIPINTTPKKKEAAPEEDAEEDPVLVLGQSYFTDAEDDWVVVDEPDEDDDWVVVPDAEDDWVVVPTEEGAQEEGAGEGEGEGEGEKKKKSGIDLRLQLGKWFSGETLDDNWFRRLLPAEGTKNSPWKRRVPLPGIRLFPFQRTTSANNKEAVYTLALRGDLLSLGFDIRGRTKKGLTFLNLEKGLLTYFGLGGVEVRLALLTTSGRVAFGIGVKLKDLRLSFGDKEEEKKEDEKEKSGDDIVAGLQKLLGDDDWVSVSAPKPKELKPTTRLGGKKKDKFSISVGYLSPLTDGGAGTLDVQLYDEKGVRGKTIWIPLDLRGPALYVKDLGIGLKGLENVELGKGLSDKAELTVAVNGGMRCFFFELGFIGAQLSFSLTDIRKLKFSLAGLDISLVAGDVRISGSFMKSGLEYTGSLFIELPKLSIAAVGMYGQFIVFSIADDQEVWRSLLAYKIHPKLSKELSDRNITPVARGPVNDTFPVTGAWTIDTVGGTRYTVIRDGGKFHLVKPEKTFFFYGMISAGAGGGPQLGPIQINAVALGVGINRRLVVPRIEEVAGFPLVKMVMGEGGYQKDDESGTFRGQVSKEVKPGEILKDLGDAVLPEEGQYFACIGARFAIARVLDCFALVVVHFNDKFEFELTVMGLARLKQPSDPSAKPICYVEMQLLMSIKPKEGEFKLQALLTDNSWVLNKDCKLTGGFAVFGWWKGPHKGDFVITLGGYHPRFKRPDHYPIVPRLGLNWRVSPELSIKGGIYLAFTPSCGMVGARLEAVFRSDRVSVWFTAFFDVVVNWSPLSFEAEIGISLRVEVNLFLFTFKATLGVTLKMWGPPVGGIVRLDLAVISFDIPFGATREEARPKPIESWERFCRSFIPPSEADKGTHGPFPWFSPITNPFLIGGRSNSAGLPEAQPKPDAAKPAEEPWRVRPDQLELGATAAVPLTTLRVGTVKTNSPAVGVQGRSPSGNSLLVTEAVKLEDAGLKVKEYGNPLGVHPMGKTLKSVLNVTVVRDKGSQATSVDLSDWSVETETASLPAALWDVSKPKPDGPSEPTADLVPDCITGIKGLKPPAGRRGNKVTFSKMTWHALEPATVPRTSAEQRVPKKADSRDVQTAAAGKANKHEGYAVALAAAGFNLAWLPPQSPVRFRELQAEPLAGEVAPSAR